MVSSSTQILLEGGPVISTPVLLKPELTPFLFPSPDFIQGFGIVHPAIEDGVRNLFGVAKIIQRIAIDDQQISQFSFFQRTDLVVHAQVLRAVDGGGFEGVVVTMPPWPIIHSSQCAPRPWSWPWLPTLMPTPNSFSFASERLVSW
jgi:hypothetical protein